jgi:hypothetical protein
LQGDVGRGIGLEGEAGSDEEDGGRIRERAKGKVLPLIGQLEQDVATAQMRVDQLENECPSDWSPIKNELDELFGTVGSKLDRTFQDMSSREVLW